MQQLQCSGRRIAECWGVIAAGQGNSQAQAWSHPSPAGEDGMACRRCQKRWCGLATTLGNGLFERLFDAWHHVSQWPDLPDASCQCDRGAVVQQSTPPVGRGSDRAPMSCKIDR